MNSKSKIQNLSAPVMQEMEHRHTRWGTVEYIRIYTPDRRRLGWDEIWEKLSESFPCRWAVQFFPPVDELVNDANIYHLFVLPEHEWPDGFSIRR